jgi:hypothetical protein
MFKKILQQLDIINKNLTIDKKCSIVDLGRRGDEG